jgi:hypothetical protein
MEEIYEMVKKLLIKRGYRVLRNTPYCKLFQSKHNNICSGCESEIGCGKIVEVYQAMLKVLEIKENNPDQLEEALAWLEDKVRAILREN